MLFLYAFTPALLAASVDPAQRLHPHMRSIGLGPLLDFATRPGNLVFPVLLATTAIVFAVLLLDRSFDRSRFWAWKRARRDLRRVLALFAINALIVAAATWYLCFRTDVLPERAFFALPRRNPLFLAAIWCLYPVFSAYPQEITHRAFFFHRYGSLIPSAPGAIIVNAVLFSWMHALFWNIPALAMTLAGGLYFAWTYTRTRSALASGIEHALYGNLVFTTGLGWFVYAGSINAS